MIHIKSLSRLVPTVLGSLIIPLLWCSLIINLTGLSNNTIHAKENLHQIFMMINNNYLLAIFLSGFAGIVFPHLENERLGSKILNFCVGATGAACVICSFKIAQILFYVI